MMFNDEVWKILESEPPKGDNLNARLLLPELSKKLYAGIDSSKQRHILIPLNDKEKGLSDSQSRGLSVVTKDLVVGGFKPQRYLDIICQDSNGHIIFNVIAKEIVECLERGEPQEIVANVISKWRRFWRQAPKEMLSYEQIIGLYAELWFLYNWMFKKLDVSKAVNSWRGPFSSRHDFEMKGKSIEAKATTKQQNRTHKVHGIDQLSPPENSKLMFFSLRLREEQGAENDLPLLIGLIQEKLKENIETLSKFENTLAVAGYSPVYNEEYSKLKFRIVDQKLFDVTDEFPRIINDSFVSGLPSGVGTIEYTISLDGYDKLCIAKSPDDDFKF